LIFRFGCFRHSDISLLNINLFLVSTFAHTKEESGLHVDVLSKLTSEIALSVHI
jgi:hypothetical protein